MEPIRYAGFAGCNFALQPRLLPAEVGVLCENQKPGRGDLRPWRVPLNVATVPAGRKTIYRFNREVRSDALYWFSFTTVAHVVRAFLADDTTERTYYAAATGGLKATDNLTGIATAPYPTTARDVGVPAPIAAPVLLETTPGTGSNETRFYAYVYVNDWNEVSAPSPVSAPFTCKPGAVVAISGMSIVPGGSHGINRIRIYRTQAGATGADFFFLREITAATTSTDDARALGSDVMESAGPAGTVGLQWSVPPANLKCPLGMWNGMMAGISGKSVRVCEPFKPYAWPPAYETLTQDQPVALAMCGRNVVILTTGTPSLLYGSAPESLESPPVPMVLPCESVAGVVSFDHGVVWPSTDGLAYVSANGVPKLLTDGLMTRDDWKLLSPTTMVAGQFDGFYVCFYDTGAGFKGFVIDPLNPAGFYPLTTGYPACYYDKLQGFLYVLDGVNVARWDAGAAFMTVLSRSKVFRQPRASNPAVAEVISDSYPVTFKLWAGQFGDAGWPAGSLKITKTVVGRGIVRLPSGYLADDIQIEVSGTGAVVGAVVAGSVNDIRQT